MAIKPIKTDEQVTLSTTIEGNVVTTVHTVKPDGGENTPRYNLKWSFDFGDVTRAELLTLAERTLRIRQQGVWRKSKNNLDEKVWHNVTFKVREMLDNRRTADNVTKAANIAAKMTEAERAALLQLLSKK